MLTRTLSPLSTPSCAAVCALSRTRLLGFTLAQAIRADAHGAHGVGLVTGEQQRPLGRLERLIERRAVRQLGAEKRGVPLRVLPALAVAAAAHLGFHTISGLGQRLLG